MPVSIPLLPPPPGPGPGPGPSNFDRVDCSVNSGRVDSMYSTTSFLHTQTAGNVVGGFNGGGTGNKSILGYRTADGLTLAAWDKTLEYTWKSLAISTSPLLVYANMVVDLHGDGSLYKIFVVDPAALPALLVCTTVVNGDGSRTTTHAASQNVQVVLDFPPVPPVPIDVNLGPLWQDHSYKVSDIIAAYPLARFKEAPSGDGGLPKLQTTPAFMLITGDSTTNAILAFSVTNAKFNGISV